ncbi:MAG: TIR domain-containing protein [Gammaproteobacteria bacterium]|nr:TIR domain-containing protein [Gammaproteobacteria bacterium]MYC25126.1 TIR domain-containing protein [Gammaproteobacteria bacterium]
MVEKQFEYEIGLSFAGEQRDFVQHFADELTSYGIRVFLDEYEKAGLWGKDLSAHLAEIYQHKCKYCILFASTDYATKAWPDHERQSAQARAIQQKEEYILPVKIDDTQIPGLSDTIHYVDLRETSLEELVQLTLIKLGNPLRKDYFPPVPDRLYERLEVSDSLELQEHVYSHATSFFQVLKRMNVDERYAVQSLLRHGCPAHLPDEIHIDADLLRRVTGMSVPKLKRLLGGLRSLGFECSLREETEEAHGAHSQCELLGDSYYFDLNWVNLGDLNEFPPLLVAAEMVVVATQNYCECCGADSLLHLDFSQLASQSPQKQIELERRIHDAQTKVVQ